MKVISRLLDSCKKSLVFVAVTGLACVVVSAEDVQAIPMIDIVSFQISTDYDMDGDGDLDFYGLYNITNVGTGDLGGLFFNVGTDNGIFIVGTYPYDMGFYLGVTKGPFSITDDLISMAPNNYSPGDNIALTIISDYTNMGTGQIWGADVFGFLSNYEDVIIPIAPVPEPATMLLFGTGLVGLVGYRTRKNKK